MTNREKFIQIYKEKITREGADKLLDYLTSDKCDFFTAPGKHPLSRRLRRRAAGAFAQRVRMPLPDRTAAPRKIRL